MPVYYKDGYKFVAPSKTKHKKYDVYDIQTDKKIASFGDNRFQQFHDSISSYYSHLNHGDNKRRILYKLRHKKDLANKHGAGYFSYKYLWS